MKVAYAFFSGFVAGCALVLFLLGGAARRDAASATPQAARESRRTPTAVSPPGEATHAESEPVLVRSPSTPRPVDPVARRAGLTIPVQGVRAEQLRDTFDEVRGGGARTHEAIDIMAPRGTPVVAVASGRIAKLFLSRAGGITIYQESRDRKLMYYYAHLDRYADGLREGSNVSRGEVIGYVGSSGNALVDAPHLHFAVFRLPPTREWWKGEPMNPYPLLTAR